MSMVEEYAGDKLFAHVAGRQHGSFPAYSYNRLIKNPKQLKARLIKYGKRLDVSRQVTSMDEEM